MKLLDLYTKFCRIPFGVTNGVASFQRVMDDVIKRDLNGTYAYIDNVTICGQNQAENDLNLKQEIAKSSLWKSKLMLQNASLTQNGRPIPFFSRTLTSAEQKHSSVVKEACAIVEAIRKWRHLLLGKHFKLITDQKSVSFMFNPKRKNKIKNKKITK